MRLPPKIPATALKGCAQSISVPLSLNPKIGLKDCCMKLAVAFKRLGFLG